MEIFHRPDNHRLICEHCPLILPCLTVNPPYTRAMSLLKVDRLAKSFGAIRAVDGVSFEVRPGEIYGLLGPNGAGKTTTISMVCGLLKSDAGEVMLAGIPFGSDPKKAKSIMGVVPQELAVYEELTARENLEFWGRIAGLKGGDTS